MQRLRRTAAIVFAGDRRVWVAAAVAAIPALALLAHYCLKSRPYFTGTDSVEAVTYIAETPAGEPVCISGLEIPADTARIRMLMISRTQLRPALTMELKLPGGHTVRSVLPPMSVTPNRISGPEFPVPRFPATPAQTPASLCVTAGDLVNWAGTPLPVPPPGAPTAGGHPLGGRLAVWYLPPVGQESSYLSRIAAIMSRAALFRPGLVGPWLYYLILFAVLPGLALLSVRCVAVAAARGPDIRARRLGALLFAIAVVNFACWALITPAFQAPDEVDHFAYTQSLVERGEAPVKTVGIERQRWSSSERLALEDSSFLTDHQIGDTRVPWSAAAQTRYRDQAAATHPSAADGGGYTTAATHGAIYYSLLAPAYLLASSSPFDQLTLMRLASALIGALTVLFAFLLARELAPGRPWLAVLAALLVAYQPMYGFISASVNSDVGVNAGAAALELLLILILRRGFSAVLAILTGALLIALPIVKGTGNELFPIAAIALLLALLRHHRRRDLVGAGALVLTGLAARGIAGALSPAFRPQLPAHATAGAGTATTASLVGGALNTVTAHTGGYLSYLWQVFLPRLPFMTRHFETPTLPAFIIYVERGWGAFGWYDVFFPQWVYSVIVTVMLAVPVLALVAAYREWPYVRRNLPEALVLILIPLGIVAAVEAAYYTREVWVQLPEFGRYAFPAIAPLAVLVVASLHAFGRRWALIAGSVLLMAMLALSYSAQLVTLTGFYA